MIKDKRKTEKKRYKKRVKELKRGRCRLMGEEIVTLNSNRIVKRYFLRINNETKRPIPRENKLTKTPPCCFSRARVPVLAHIVTE